MNVQPIMLATFLIQIAGILWVLVQNRSHLACQLTAVILTLLAVCQFAQYMLCEQTLWLTHVAWENIGFASFTLLPVFLQYLALAITGKKQSAFLLQGFALAIGFISYFISIAQVQSNSLCMNQDSMLTMLPKIEYQYALYYYVWLCISVVCVILLSRTAYQYKEGTSHLGMASALFLLPIAAYHLVPQHLLLVIPNMMYGLEIMLSLSLIFGVLPRAGVHLRRFDLTEWLLGM